MHYILITEIQLGWPSTSYFAINFTKYNSASISHNQLQMPQFDNEKWLLFFIYYLFETINKLQFWQVEQIF